MLLGSNSWLGCHCRSRLTESIIVLVFSVAFALAMGTTTFVARRVGEKDPEGASLATVQSIVCGLAIAIVTGIAGASSALRLLGLMGATPEVIRAGPGYSASCWATTS